MHEHELTDEQRAVIDFVASGKGNLLVEALAGSGKSFSLLKSLEVLPQRSALLCAFNKPIAVELDAKVKALGLPKTMAVHVRTFHAQGLVIVKAYKAGLEIDKTATQELINSVAQPGVSFQSKRAAVRLLRQIKESYTAPAANGAPTDVYVQSVGFEYNMFGKMRDHEIAHTTNMVRAAYVASLDLKARTKIDFCDMVWLPVVLDLAPPSRYQAVFVDELQDISKPQLAMIGKLIAPGGRFIGVGDRLQQLYSFRGSMGAAAWDVIKDDLKAHVLPLTTSFRCSQAVVEDANRIVPKLRAWKDAVPGSVGKCTLKSLPTRLGKGYSEKPHTFVLSRTNADLLDVALFLWTERVPFQLKAGQDLLEPILDLVDELDLRDANKFRDSVSKWSLNQLAKAEALGSATWADMIEEQVKMLLSTVGFVHPRQIKATLLAMLQPSGAGVLLSTVHKVKGLEADRVFLLEQTFKSHDEMTIAPDYRPKVSEEECAIEYVAITRAREHLVWVDMHRTSSEDVATFQIDDSVATAPIEALRTWSTSWLFEAHEKVEAKALDLIDRKRDDAAAEKWMQLAERIMKVLKERAHG